MSFNDVGEVIKVKGSIEGIGIADKPCSDDQEKREKPFDYLAGVKFRHLIL